MCKCKSQFFITNNPGKKKKLNNCFCTPDFRNARPAFTTTDFPDLPFSESSSLLAARNPHYPSSTPFFVSFHLRK